MRSSKVDAIEARRALSTPVRAEITNTQTNPAKTSTWTRIEEQWNAIQVARQGSYSIERVESLDYYCRTTSRTRVLLVCIFTPLSALTFAVLLEFLPLRAPSEGWKANWVFWIRLGLSVFIVSYAAISQLVIFVPGLNATFAKRLVTALAASTCFVGTCLIGATTIGFPVPLTSQLGGASMGICLPALIRIVLGRKPFEKSSELRPHLKRFYRLLLAYIALVGVYPLFKLLYDRLPVAYHGCAVVALPVWRFGAKHFMMHASRQLEDFMPELVAFSVDFLSSLFVSVCISTSGSLYLTAAFIAVDLGQSFLEFREMRTNATAVVRLLGERHNFMRKFRDGNLLGSLDTSLLPMLLAITRDPIASNIKSLGDARLWACLPHPMSQEQMMRLRELDASGIYGSRGLTSRAPWLSRRKNSLQSMPILVGSRKLIVPTTSNACESASEVEQPIATRISEQFVLQSLQLLFHSEYLALVEYVECIVPVVFVIYKSVLEQLSNVVYFPDGAGNWGVTAVVNVLITAVLEVGSLILLIFFLQHKFSFSPLYQLAFVLETQIIAVQTKLSIALGSTNSSIKVLTSRYTLHGSMTRSYRSASDIACTL